MLRDLETADQSYASGVRKAIFTYQDIPVRLSERDVPTLMREVDNDDIMLILAAAKPEDADTKAPSEGFFVEPR